MLAQFEIFLFIFFLIPKERKKTCRAIKQLDRGREKVGSARFSHNTTQHNTSNSHEYPESSALTSQLDK
jgi:hypothetical protein